MKNKLAKFLWQTLGVFEGVCGDCLPKNWGKKCSHWKYYQDLAGDILEFMEKKK